MQSNRELEWSLAGVLIIAVLYIVYELLGAPGGSDPIGHLMGITGMTMMLMTETLYAFRKRARWFQVGRLRAWLSFHIFTGIVGPALVLTHSAFEFNGLAGLSIIFTVVVVASGFVGRYLYTAIPRTRAGAELTLAQVATQAAELQAQIDGFATDRPAHAQALMSVDARHRDEAQSGTARALLSRALIDWRYRVEVSRQLRQLDPLERRRLNELSRLLRRRREVERQIATLHSAHRLMSAWHTVHVPLGVTLFLSAFLHVIGTLYYGATRLF
jgi:hypothetical protein